MRNDVPAVVRPTLAAVTPLASEPEVHWLLQREILAWVDGEPDTVLRLTLEGDPKAKSRPRVTKGGHTYTPAETVAAEMATAVRVRNAMRGTRPEPAPASFGVMAVFFQEGRQRRDVDNMLKLVLDAITIAGKKFGHGIWVDDSQVSEVSARLVRASSDPRTHLWVYRTLIEPAPTASCEQCGATFLAYASLPNRYCSRACVTAGMRVARTVSTCRTCGKGISFTAAQPKVYCDRACRVADPAPRTRSLLSPP